MRQSDRSSRRRVIAAAVAASCLMLVFGLTYRVLAGRLAGPAATAPIDPATVGRFPMQIGEWTGQDVPIDEATVRATDTDAHINRRYTRPGAFESVTLYVACGVKARDLMPHRPEVCYTGNGWTLADKRSDELALSDGTKLPCNIMEFSRGGFSTQRIVVLDYYIVDGQYCSDVSLLRSKAWRGSGAVKYVAQVQVVTSVTATTTAESAMRLVSVFADESAASLAGLFKHEEEEPTSE
jgi:EpsI family protein